MAERQAERELLKRVHAGQRQACEELVTARYPAVYGFLLHLTQNASRAEDLTQETFAAAWRNISSFNGSGSIASWLHRIAYAKFVDSHRAGRRSAALSRWLAARPPKPPSESPLDGLISDEHARRLYRTVRALEEGHRVVIVLHYFQQMSLRETAAALRQPVGTVKWRINQALKRLRSLLPREFDHEPK